MEKRYKEDKTPHVLPYNEGVDDACSFHVRAYMRVEDRWAAKRSHKPIPSGGGSFSRGSLKG